MRAVLGGLLCLLVFQGWAVADEISDAKDRLNREIRLIEHLSNYAERPDLARLYLLRSASRTVLESIEKNGLAHKTTFQEYQKLIVAYRYSVAFFRKIETDDTKKSIIALLQLNEQIVKAHGFDDSPYTQITLSVYTQMEKLVAQLLQLSLSEATRIRLVDVKPVLGEVIAITKAKGGDRRTVYQVAERAYKAITDLYPEFNKIASSDAAFDVTLEIQGLNEFYAEFAEFK